MAAAASTSRRQFFRTIYSKKEAVPGNASTDPVFVRDIAPPPSLAVHVASRLMYGPRPGDVAAIETQGVNAWLTDQLNPGADNPELTAALNALPRETLSESVTTLYDRRNLAYSNAVRPAHQVRHATLTRMLLSRWQLFEVMTEFWHKHFNAYGYDAPMMCLWPDWDRLIRQHALGNFRQFLEATGRHPVMLHFLDNYLSTNSGPNENYARELFELHSMGAINYNVAGGYVDEDVYEASRCFTGWTYERSAASANRGQFKYIRENHDRFQKVVLGTAIPRDQADLADGQKVLDLICNNPGTSRFIALKLCRRFVSENPPESLLQSTANVFHSNRNAPNQIALTLRHIFDSAEFRDTAQYMVRFKAPYDWLMSAMRALNLPYIYREGESSFDWTWTINQLGYQMFAWRSPDGPPDDFFSWATANSLLRRYNLVFRVDAGWWTNGGLSVPSQGLMPASLRTAREIAQWWAARIIQRPISLVTFEQLMGFIAEGRNYDIKLPADQVSSKLSRLAVLCTVTPEFMWR